MNSQVNNTRDSSYSKATKSLIIALQVRIYQALFIHITYCLGFLSHYFHIMVAHNQSIL